jgi:hypothetical protein
LSLNEKTCKTNEIRRLIDLIYVDIKIWFTQSLKQNNWVKQQKFMEKREMNENISSREISLTAWERWEIKMKMKMKMKMRDKDEYEYEL